MELSPEILADLQHSTARLVEEVGRYVYGEWLKGDHTVSYKDLRDAATEVDVEAENRLRKGLHTDFTELDGRQMWIVASQALHSKTLALLQEQPESTAGA